ncbi:VOC family protein [Pseudomonas syringae group sp. J309-1]|uniref:bleomycin resistance protein n=1 Tax=Pseudomonas syringae group sp. J309-1 TaxID=3079588 RepID=UPI0029105682|nr:VOC family protein [Pseudomonas syringae group sp. J309-1]MDU8359286.1 VOC family protein [Pseudomonas syringae group sp. J309-1]
MGNALVPEFSVSDWRASKRFYCEILGFTCQYERPEEGFCYLALGDAELMIDQIGEGRTFEQGYQPDHYPFGRGLNVQIRVPSVEPLLRSLAEHHIKLFLPVEDRWYRVGAEENGNRQFVVADPDGYLLRFYERLGSRSVQDEAMAVSAFPSDEREDLRIERVAIERRAAFDEQNALSLEEMEARFK